MLSYRRLLSSLPRQCTTLNAPRSFYRTSRAASSTQAEGEGKERGAGGNWSSPSDPTWAVWKQTIGKQFEKPHRPCNWLGGKVPFPLNPSFKPPTPVSDAIKDVLYQAFMADPEANSVRNLARQHHLSIKRVDAILRLKGLEESWKKEGMPLQTAFLKGMEQILGVTFDASKHKTHVHWAESRIQTVEADALDQDEGDSQARARYQRMFWEPVVEGQEPVLPTALKRAREDAERRGRSVEPAKSRDVGPGSQHDGGVKVTSTSGAVGRPTIKFIDVGTKFMDPREHMQREKENQRRAKVRGKKRHKRLSVVA
ncbi:eukaryotic mitochondrial regulator protein-domain-containing protein [Russula earlei]|uniref:Eukaryotic mitochondrial regulator protein-domain-containing protein n=1 Tax=Russula earlei TaxID=71964 RepID=A0ACC0UNR2_9AGAM|nr:eukaryotic mitochondrial regulator protein-domain-containing protein [Russula earlei]